jgi:hypothetical protein
MPGEVDIILSALNADDYRKLTQEELAILLASSEMVRDEDTMFCDRIRILRRGGIYLVQETTNHQELIVRQVAGIEAANELVNSRLEIYEKMWNGCGCKIEYYSCQDKTTDI